MVTPMSSSLRTVRLALAAPIPTGHRVSVYWYSVEPEPGFFNANPKRKDLALPRVVDHDTGVEYSHDVHHEDAQSYVSGQIREFPVDLRSDLHEREQLTGVVRRCVVSAIGSGSTAYVQTTLLIEPE
jgi:enamine deaminase RidA (YjgF/YER057c/UK114 family)